MNNILDHFDIATLEEVLFPHIETEGQKRYHYAWRLKSGRVTLSFEQAKKLAEHSGGSLDELSGLSIKGERVGSLILSLNAQSGHTVSIKTKERVFEVLDPEGFAILSGAYPADTTIKDFIEDINTAIGMRYNEKQ